MGRSIAGVMASHILKDKKLREIVFALFYNFLEKEYTPLH